MKLLARKIYYNVYDIELISKIFIFGVIVLMMDLYCANSIAKERSSCDRIVQHYINASQRAARRHCHSPLHNIDRRELFQECQNLGSSKFWQVYRFMINTESKICPN